MGQGDSLGLTVDRRSSTPLYHQLADQMVTAIREGVLPPGTRLDSEMSLAEELGLSRPTIRSAIQDLVDRGLVVRRRGAGTQVVHDQVERELELTSLHDDLALAGKFPTTRVLFNAIQLAPMEQARPLGSDVPIKALRLERVRLVEGAPLAILRNWLPPEYIQPTSEELEEHGLYELLRQAGHNPQIARQKISAAAATQAEAAILGVRRGAPLLTMNRVAYDAQGRILEVGQHCYLPDAYSFEVTLRQQR